MELIELKQELIKYGKLAGEKNMTPGISGNISARFGDKIIITSSGSANGYLTQDDLSVIDFEGNVVEGNPKPSSEKMLHIRFYEMREDINAILHTHSPYLSAFASANQALNKPYMAENLFYFGQIPIAQYAMPSSRALVDYTSMWFDRYDAVLMANHGSIVGGKTVKDAYLKLELAESYAHVIVNSKILGGAVELNKSEVKEVLDLRTKAKNS